MAGKSKPSQANLRRAVSSAYYALFHCLAGASADLLVGGSSATRSRHAWRQVYRALEHGTAKNACKNGLVAQFPQQIEDFANAFVLLQTKRHDADYDPFVRLTKSAVVQDIATARRVVSDFSQAPIKDRRAFCAFVLFKTRQ